MGNCFRIVINKFRRKSNVKKNIVLLISGLDNAGKTLIVNRLANNEDLNTVPTMGFRVVPLKYKNFSVKVYDVGGAPQIRSIWKKYYNDVHGLIFVVDASNLSRLAENKLVFNEMVSHEQVAGKPILLLANKQDLADAIDELDLVANLGVEEAANAMKSPTRVETCSSILNPQVKYDFSGVINGYKWLLETIAKNYEGLDHRIKPPAPAANHIQRADSISSRVSVHSNPFKPINQLVSSLEQNSIASANYVNKKRERWKKFLSKNKTAPMMMTNGQSLPQKSDENTLSSIEVINDDDRVAFVMLDPLSLQHKMNQRRTWRPYTAPATSSQRLELLKINLPGQVPH